MKKLESKQLEIMQGGWSWSQCATGAAGMWASGLTAAAGSIGGPAGALGSLAFGCVAANYL